MVWLIMHEHVVYCFPLSIAVDKPDTPDSITEKTVVVIETNNKSTESLTHVSDDEPEERPASTEAVVEPVPEEIREEPTTPKKTLPKESPVTVEESKTVNSEPEYSVPVTKVVSSDSSKSSKVETPSIDNSASTKSDSDKNPYGVVLRKTGRSVVNKTETSPEKQTENDTVSDIPKKRSVANSATLFGESKITKRYSSYEPRNFTASSHTKVTVDDSRRTSDSASVEDKNEFTAMFNKVRQSNPGRNRGSPEKTAKDSADKKDADPAGESFVLKKKLRPVSMDVNSKVEPSKETPVKPQPAASKPSWVKHTENKPTSPAKVKPSTICEDKTPASPTTKQVGYM